MVRSKQERFRWLVPAVSLSMLVSMEAWKLTLPDARAGEAYLAKNREIFANFPLMAGDWEGLEVPVPKEAIASLHTNSYLSRDYFNRATQETAGILMIEVEDTRDMMGHYPPNCYPGNGWVLQEATPETWRVTGLAIPGVEYVFKRQERGREELKTVRNFFILPNGKILPEIVSFGRAAADFYIRPYGATQVQVIWNRAYLREDRDRIFDSLMRAHWNLLDAVSRKTDGKE